MGEITNPEKNEWEPFTWINPWWNSWVELDSKLDFISFHIVVRSQQKPGPRENVTSESKWNSLSQWTLKKKFELYFPY